ncbi:stage V sporulation protein AD [Thermosediminibacter oceani]|uniref:Stage V sporulation protein AD n=1 Tax=Thermosediminibacter oceani (strain ATCC BAA-1034 / DSM 16646 / JW/IW-1228P) TaxID=555079 RepID=D9S3P2_THEOJ|nr:stage V sporulation protein AD [Thermosediminibacter oceani]ADL08019.1 stage V sporulation protein AD [Thermosediminibacter oceani DSM 16646]
MALKKLGKQTVKFENPPSIIATASIVGPVEGKGPLREYFDLILSDVNFQEKSWEKAEKKMLKEAAEMAIRKSGVPGEQIEYFIAGDLLNQIIAASFAARELGFPFFGIYGACSTMAEGLGLGAMLVDGGYADNLVVGTSSHFCTAERQYRFPLELGNQRPPTAQRTTTGAGAAVISSKDQNPRITYMTTGKVIDMGEANPNDMGTAMAPAAVDTIVRHLEDSNRSPEDYDLIITGDLASVGKDIAERLLKQKGIDISDRYTDCGLLIYSPQQDVHAGGSGCACAAVVTCGYLYKEMQKGRYNRILLVATGALLSTTSVQQGETIPCIAHAVALENL